jgi:predicted RNase H-like HicB family nuclease
MNPNLRGEAERLANRAYTIEVARDETTDGEPAYVAYVLELEGCMGQGLTSEEAEADVRLAIVDFIESMLEDNLPVPEPQQKFPTTTTTSGSTNLVRGFKPDQDKAGDEIDMPRHTRRFVIEPSPSH